MFKKVRLARPEAAKNLRRTVSTLKVLSHENAADGLFQHFHPGSLRGSPSPAAAQLAPLKQCSPKTPESAALLGHAKGD